MHDKMRFWEQKFFSCVLWNGVSGGERDEAADDSDLFARVLYVDVSCSNNMIKRAGFSKIRQGFYRAVTTKPPKVRRHQRQPKSSVGRL